MVCTGTIHNGVVVMDKGTELAEGTRVRIEPVERPEEAATPGGYEDLLELVGTIRDAPPDLSRNLDHYLYGLPKQ